MRLNAPFSLAAWLFLAVPLLAVHGVLPSVPLMTLSANKEIQHPIALVYRGQAGCPRCSEAVAGLLERSQWHFAVSYVGPGERLHLSTATLKTATIYVQPGGNGSLAHAYALLRADTPLIQHFVASGGHYLGFCMGGYLAGATPGFHLLPGDANEFITSPGASVKTPTDTTVQVRWRGQLRTLYFQDGPYFIIRPSAPDVTILARYTNGKIAALVTPYGRGTVGVSGPHPEATDTWYRVHHLAVPTSLNWDLGYDLINTLMHAPPAN